MDLILLCVCVCECASALKPYTFVYCFLQERHTFVLTRRTFDTTEIKLCMDGIMSVN